MSTELFTGFAVAFGVSLLLVLTKHWHGTSVWTIPTVFKSSTPNPPPVSVAWASQPA